jgi:hypothetical protein
MGPRERATSAAEGPTPEQREAERRLDALCVENACAMVERLLGEHTEPANWTAVTRHATEQTAGEGGDYQKFTAWYAVTYSELYGVTIQYWTWVNSIERYPAAGRLEVRLPRTPTGTPEWRPIHTVDGLKQLGEYLEADQPKDRGQPQDRRPDPYR